MTGNGDSSLAARTFWLPVIVFWTIVAANKLQPEMLAVTFDFGSLRVSDYALIDRNRDPERDEIIFYTLDGVDYVGRLIGVPGDRLTYDPFTQAVFRDGGLLVRAPPGYEIDAQWTGLVVLEPTQYAIYVHRPGRNPASALIPRDAIYGPLNRYLRRSELSGSDWAWIAVASAWLITLFIVPLFGYFTTRPRGVWRTIVFVPHVLVTALGFTAWVSVTVASEFFDHSFEPAWWAVPLGFFRGTGLWALAAVLAFVALSQLAAAAREPATERS